MTPQTAMWTFRSFLFIILFASSATLIQGQRSAEEAFSEGNAALVADNIPAAIAAYNEALMAGSSANLHYNLGTAYARAEDWGWASLHFHKALALNPNHADARAHLALVRKRAELDWQDQGALEQFASALSLSSWAWIATAAFWSVVLLTIIPPPGGSLLNNFLRISLVVVVAISALALLQYHLDRSRGVVLQTSQLRVAATEKSPTSAELTPGMEATVLKKMNGFYLVQTENGAEGYLSKAEFSRVWEE